MQPQWINRMTAWVVSLAGLTALLLPVLPARAAPFDGTRGQFRDDAFRTVWARTDSESVRGGRSWYWGPQPWFDYAEFYRQGVNGLRTVQYFDKARMEINDPANRSFQGGVTNGLLVVELVSGQLKRGNDPWDNDFRTPADVPVAGNPKADNPNAPAYAVFAGIATINNNGYRDPNRLGQRVEAALDRGGNISARPDLARPETEIVQYNTVTGHNIPRVFWNFMNLTGPVIEGGVRRGATVVDWTFAMGLPITDAYWTRAKVGAAETDVLVQLFERRVLTYTPTNPGGYKVEMGNVGQHYFQWRYPHLGAAWTLPDPNPPLLFASDTLTPNTWQIAQWQFGANSYASLTGEKAESVAFSFRRSYDPGLTRVAFDSRRGNGENRQLYALESGALFGTPGETRVSRLTFSDGTPPPPPSNAGWGPGKANDYNPSVSPDGTKIAFASDREGNPRLYLMTFDGSFAVPLTADNCASQIPGWSPDGRTLFWERQCPNGKFQIMRGDLSYNDDALLYLGAQLVNVRELTDQGSDNRFPRVSPDGRQIAFSSYRDGNAEVYLMNPDGTSQRRLTSSAGEDEAPTWSADSRQLAFASNRDGNYEIYLISRDGLGETRLTTTASQERWPLWAQ
jgi:hypothetical protein